MRLLKCFNIYCSLLLMLVFINIETYAIVDIFIDDGVIISDTTTQLEDVKLYRTIEQETAFDEVFNTFISFVTLTAIFLICPFLIINLKSRLQTKISNTPASILHKILELLPKKQQEILIQEILDMRSEYYGALSERKIWRARFIVVFYYIGLGWSVIMWISDKVKEVIGIIPKKN